VVVELMADVFRQSVEPVVWQIRPYALKDTKCARITKPRTEHPEMNAGGSKHYFCPVPPQVGQVIFPIPEHLGHSFPFTFLAPLHIGHNIVF
jgi:hypothetical protein